MLLVKNIGQWELSLEAKRSTWALPKTFHIFWTASGWSIHSSEETLLLNNMSASWFILPGTCVAFSERKLFWAHTRMSFNSMQSWSMESLRDEAALVIYLIPRTCCPSVLAHGVRVCPAGRVDRPDTLLAFLGSLCAGPIPLQTIDRRSVCPRTALPNPYWKRLSWQPSFCAPCLESCLALARGGSSNRPGLIHRPESLLRGASVTPSHGCNSLFQPELDGLHMKQTQPKYRRMPLP